MPDVIVLINHIKAVKIVNVIMTFFYIGVYCEIAHAERCKVLKEMGSLAGVYPVVFQT